MSGTAGRTGRTLCLGVGNAHRGDDGIGPAVVRAVAGRVPPGVDCRVEEGEVARLMAAWEGYAAVVLVDAVAMAGPTGRLVRADPSGGWSAFATGDASSHGLGVVEALRLSEVLGTLPPRVDLILVNGCAFGHGETLSRPLRDGFAGYVSAVERQVREAMAHA